jgi:RHS repeat-associated protein
MLLTEEGYIEKSGSTYTHHYYLKDHIGNHRIVMNSAGTVVQATNYYPSGTTMADYPRATTQGVQPYKFGGKELDRKDNLNFYDYEARAYDPALMRFTSTDPMMEKYYGWSPYAYCANNPMMFIDPDGRDWIVADGTTNYQWRDDINAKSTMPEGFQYVGANDVDILTHLGMNYKFKELSTNKIGLVAADVELGSHAISHMVNVKEKSNATISTNVSFSKDNATENNSMGRTFNGVSINVTEVSSNSGVDGEMMSGGLVSVQYGNKNYQSALKEPEGAYFRQTGTTIGVATVNIPQSDLSVGSKFSQIQVKGNWFVKRPEGITPVTIYPGGNFIPIPLIFKHAWTFKR